MLLKKTRNGESIDDLAGEIDYMVYKIYGLTESEIHKVEVFVDDQRKL